MNKLLFKFISYFEYRFKAKDEHSIHSPFIFNFYLNAVKNNQHFYAFHEIESIRFALLDSEEKIMKTDYGAGKNSGMISVSKLARQSKNYQWCRILFKTVNYLQCKKIIELGTALGISGSYIQSANKKGKFISIEGCKNTAAIAKNVFRKLKLNDENILIGNFDELFSNELQKMGNVDMVYFDGNHSYEATINYFNLALPFIHNNTIFIFDDIYWSAGMKKAWQEIISSTTVKASIDLFELGIVFFRQELTKQHFILKT